jgi:hypothetical protein
MSSLFGTSLQEEAYSSCRGAELKGRDISRRTFAYKKGSETDGQKAADAISIWYLDVDTCEEKVWLTNESSSASQNGV